MASNKWKVKIVTLLGFLLNVAGVLLTAVGIYRIISSFEEELKASHITPIIIACYCFLFSLLFVRDNKDSTNPNKAIISNAWRFIGVFTVFVIILILLLIRIKLLTF